MPPLTVSNSASNTFLTALLWHFSPAMSSAMSQTEAASDALAQIQTAVENNLDALEAATEEAQVEYDADTLVNATISSDGDFEVQDVEDGVADDAVYIAGIVPMLDSDNRQFNDPTVLVSSHYDTREALQEGFEDDALFSSQWDEGADWRVIANPMHDDDPTIEEALGALVRTAAEMGFDISVSLNGAEDLLRAE